jgi:hypothetical protein
MNVEIRRAPESRESAMPLKGKVAIITGGNSEIRHAIVLELARAACQSCRH